MRTKLYAPLAALIAAASLPALCSAQGFAPITPPPDVVAYPSAAVPAGSPGDGPWVETQDSPIALRLTRASLELARGQSLEQGPAVQQSYVGWQQLLKTNGPKDMATLQAHARYLNTYSAVQGEAVKVYDSVLANLPDDSEVAPGPGGEKPTDPLLVEVEDMMGDWTTLSGSTAAACQIDPDSCVGLDPQEAQLVEEIRGHLDVLEGQDPTTDLSPSALRRRATLLKMRARIGQRLAQRAAQQIVLEVAASTHGHGAGGRLPKLLGSTRTRRAAKRVVPSDPYVD